MVKSITDVAVFSSGLIFGTASSILSKLLFDQKTPWQDGSGLEKNFEKPLFQTTMMFVGMTLALPIHYLFQFISSVRQKRAENNSEGRPLVYRAEKEEPFQLTWRTASLLFIPSIFDLVATAFAMVGLVMIDVSIYQLMKCSVIIFVAILKSTVLKIKLHKFMWFGVFINMLAVTMVASTSFFPSGDPEDVKAPGTESSSTTAIIGIGLVVLSCVVQSGQYVFEEKVMGEGSFSIPPLIVVGMEGFWGLLLSICVVLPAANFIPGNDCPIEQGLHCAKPVYESTLDTFHMLKSDHKIVISTCVYVFVITGYNAACIFITFLLDSVWHAILDNFRPLSVWIVQLALFGITSGAFGEKWTNGSYLQLGGLILLLLGTAIYNGNLRLNKVFDYPLDVEDEEEAQPILDESSYGLYNPLSSHSMNSSSSLTFTAKMFYSRPPPNSRRVSITQTPHSEILTSLVGSYQTSSAPQYSRSVRNFR